MSRSADMLHRSLMFRWLIDVTVYVLKKHEGDVRGGQQGEYFLEHGGGDILTCSPNTLHPTFPIMHLNSRCHPALPDKLHRCISFLLIVLSSLLDCRSNWKCFWSAVRPKYSKL